MLASCLRFLSSAVLLGALVVTTGCGSTAASPTTPEPASVTQVFNGSVAQSGSTFYSFTTTQAGTVSFQLTKVQRNGVTVPELLSIGVGVPRATDCAVQTSVTVGADPGLLLSSSRGADVHCVRVWDAGNLTGPVTFSVNINRPIQ